MHIGPPKLLETGLLNIKYDFEGKLCEKCTCADCGNDGKIEEAMATDNNKDNDKEDF